MKIIVVGGKGLIGSAVVKELSPRHQVMTAGREGCDLQCDITSEDSIRSMYAKAGAFDAMVATLGYVPFKEFSQMTSADYRKGLDDKLMGQVNLVLIGREFIKEQGSFTLTSGILNCDPIPTGSVASMVNGALEGFVRGVSIGLPKQLRINVVSPTVIAEAMKDYAPYFRGFDPVPVAKAALAYSKSVEGLQTGQVYYVV